MFSWITLVLAFFILICSQRFLFVKDLSLSKVLKSILNHLICLSTLHSLHCISQRVDKTDYFVCLTAKQYSTDCIFLKWNTYNISVMTGQKPFKYSWIKDNEVNCKKLYFWQKQKNEGDYWRCFFLLALILATNTVHEHHQHNAVLCGVWLTVITGQIEFSRKWMGYNKLHLGHWQ